MALPEKQRIGLERIEKDFKQANIRRALTSIHFYDREEITIKPSADDVACDNTEIMRAFIVIALIIKAATLQAALLPKRLTTAS